MDGSSVAVLTDADETSCMASHIRENYRSKRYPTGFWLASRHPCSRSSTAERAPALPCVGRRWVRTRAEFTEDWQALWLDPLGNVSHCVYSGEFSSLRNKSLLVEYLWTLVTRFFSNIASMYPGMVMLTSSGIRSTKRLTQADKKIIKNNVKKSTGSNH